MLNRRSGLAGAPSLRYSSASNDGIFIRRVSAFADEGKHSDQDEVLCPEWGSPDLTSRCGGASAISWSADNLYVQQRDASIASLAVLESPKSSYIGSPTRCTGGGHGEVVPSSSGYKLSVGSDPASIPQSLISPTRKSTTLARHLAERALLTRTTRRSIDCPTQLRTRESAPVQSSQPSATSNIVSPLSCSNVERLPSFARASIPAILTLNESPSPSHATPRLPDSASPHSPHPPLHASPPSSSNILVPWITSKEASSASSANRTLTPVTPTGATPTRPGRHVYLGASRNPRPPSSVPSSGAEGYFDAAMISGGRGKAVSGGSLAAVVRRPSSPPPFTPRQPPSSGLINLWAGAPAAMRRGEWSMAQYTIARQLYGGYASSVFKARCLRSGLDVVLKVYTLSSLSDFLRNQVLRELDIHARLEHPGVVQLLASFREGDKLVLVLEYVRGGSLDRARRKLGGRLSEQQALELVMVPLLRTLHYLHCKAIVHRDIKPENILFTPDWKLKVCDYGVSVCLLEERAVTRTGSRDYMAPEVQVCPLKRAPDDNKNNPQMAYGASADIWSLGVLTYELLVGFTPFPGGPPPVDEKPAGGIGRTLAFPSCVSADARSFVHSCLQDMPGDRPTIFELLKHRWVQGCLVRVERVEGLARSKHGGLAAAPVGAEKAAVTPPIPVFAWHL